MQIKDTNQSKRGHLVLAVVCMLLQVMLSPSIGMGNGRINFALVYAGVYALSVGGRPSVVVGFLAGLVFDLISAGPVGLMAGLLTVLSFGLGIEERNRFADGFVLPMSSFGVGSFLVILVFHMAMLLTGESASMADVLLQRTLPTFALTFVAFLPFAYVQVHGAAGPRGMHMGKGAGLRERRYETKNL